MTTRKDFWRDVKCRIDVVEISTDFAPNPLWKLIHKKRQALRDYIVFAVKERIEQLLEEADENQDNNMPIMRSGNSLAYDGEREEAPGEHQADDHFDRR